MSLSEQNRALIERLLDRCAISHQTADYLIDHWGQANLLLDAARAEGVAALQQEGEPVAWSRDEIATAVQTEGQTIAAQALLELGYRYQDDPDGISPAAYYIADAILSLPQQTALVEQGVEKIIAQHEPAACGASAPSEAPRSDGGKITMIYKIVSDGRDDGLSDGEIAAAIVEALS